MGLDNGVVLRITDKEKFGDLPKWFAKAFQYDENTYEVMYWRKCYNVRELALDLFEDLYDDETCEIKLTLELLKIFNRELKTIYNRKAWDEGDSIWTWKECRSNRKRGLRFSKRVVKWLKDKPEDSYELSFYDSY